MDACSDAMGRCKDDESERKWERRLVIVIWLAGEWQDRPILCLGQLLSTKCSPVAGTGPGMHACSFKLVGRFGLFPIWTNSF